MIQDPFEMPSSQPEGERERRLADIFCEYARRIEGGEELDREEIRRLHPDLAEDLLRDLESFEAVGAELGPAEPLGTLGDYTLRRRIGRGGMGVVYEAWQGSMDRRVALKVLPPGMAADAKTVGRFVREARAAGKLHHPNVVSVYGMGVESSTPYYAMELVEGETLAQILERLRALEGRDDEKRGLLESVSDLLGRKAASEPAEAEAAGEEGEAAGKKTAFGTDEIDLAYYSNLSRAFAGVADGLQHAHSKGVVHRDIKPSNLILETFVAPGPDAEGGAAGSGAGSGSGSTRNAEGAPAPRLRILDFGLARLEGQESLSASGDFVGTPLYMSPEQARRKKVSIDHRTDVYSLGATLYEVLTLEPPFRGKDHEDTLSQIIQRDPRPPRQLNSRVPRDLETIVLKCLRREPGDRYGTAEALGQDLRRFVRGDPIEARPQAAWEKAARRAWRLRWPVLGVVAALVSLALALSLLRADLQNRHRIRVEAYERAVLAALRDIECGRLQRNGVVRLTIPDPAARSSGKLSRKWQGGRLERAVARLAEAEVLFPGRPEAAYHGARALNALGRRDESLRWLDRLYAGNSRFVPGLVLAASIRERRGEKEAAARLWARAEDAAGEDWSKAWLAAARAKVALRWLEEAAALEATIHAASRASEPYLGSSIEVWVERSSAWLEGRDFRRAAEGFSGVLALWPEYNEAGLFLAKSYYLNGRKADAEEVFQDTFARASPEDADDVAFDIACGSYSAFCDYERALPWAARVVDPALREIARYTPLVGSGRLSEALEAAELAVKLASEDFRAWSYLASITWSESAARKALELVSPMPWDWWWLNVLRMVGTLGNRDGELARAEAGFLRFVQEDPCNSEALGGLAGLYRTQGNLALAETFCRKAMEFAPVENYYRATLARIRADQGRLEDAEQEYRTAIAGVPGPCIETFLLGQHLAIRMQRLDDAVPFLLEAIRIDPRWSEPREVLGHVLEEQGKFADAIGEHGRALVCVPARTHSRDALLEIHLRVLDDPGLAPAWDGLVGEIEKIPGAGDEPRLLALLAVGTLRGSARRDLGRARESIERAETLSPDDPAILSVLAEVRLAQGLRGEAIRILERAKPVPTGSTLEGDRLAAFRRAHLPDLASLASVDAALDAAEPGADGEKALLEGYLPLAEASGDLRILPYLEGRILERSGLCLEAAGKYQQILANGPDPRVALHLSGCLRESSMFMDAARVLEEGIVGSGEECRDLWDLWVSLSLDDLKMSPAEALQAMPPATGYGDDIAWLLEAIDAGTGIRIRCGGEECRDSKGRVWGKDRFFLGGNDTVDAKLTVEATEDSVLYKRERWFPPGSLAIYRIPLPRGSYRVILHSSEVFFTAPGQRRFDVRIEGQEVLRDYEPPIRKADVREFPVRVEDGILEIEFLPRLENPKISAIEVLGPFP